MRRDCLKSALLSMLVCYLLGRSTNTIESNTKALFDASTEEVLEINANKTKYIQ
jgi:hypothetical protein